MNLVIIGVGKVGETLVANLINENHDIVVVDISSERVQEVVNRYDVNGVTGGGIERSVLLDAGVDKADFVIACTAQDEKNILCCVLARKLGAKSTIARVRDPEYFKEMENMRDDLGLDYSFNPELETAKEICQVLKFPSANSVESFADGGANMVEFTVLNGNPMIDKQIKDISAEYGNDFLFAMIARENEVFIPRGDFVIKAGDIVYLIASENSLANFTKKLQIFKRRSKSVFIIGGGKIAYYLAKQLISSGVSVKIIEKDEARANELSGSLPSATILLCDGTEQEVLEEEKLKDSDACVALTGIDEENVIISLYAKEQGVSKVITKVDRPSVHNMVKQLGLDTVVSPRKVIANEIVRFVRAHQAFTGNGINTLYKLSDKAEALEFTVGNDFPKIDVAIKDLGVKNGILLGGIVRDNQFVLPSGETKLRKGDKVIVVTAIRNITELSQILR
ncbi:MAG: Trk system potassium transporter TrkA [Clostridiales bacterium]|nr:Trk system potassium transporter TrkA [Clostridiales bacterium]